MIARTHSPSNENRATSSVLAANNALCGVCPNLSMGSDSIGVRPTPGKCPGEALRLQRVELTRSIPILPPRSQWPFYSLIYSLKRGFRGFVSSESVKKILRFHPIKSGVKRGDSGILSPRIPKIPTRIFLVRPAWCRRGKTRKNQ